VPSAASLTGAQEEDRGEAEGSQEICQLADASYPGLS
jgi:hypothetical protein